MIGRPQKRTSVNKPHMLVGNCFICGGKIYCSGTTYYCRNIGEGLCDFQLRINSLKSLGKEKLTIEEMAMLLDSKVIDLIGLVGKGGECFDTNGILSWSEKYGWHIKLYNRGFTFNSHE